MSSPTLTGILNEIRTQSSNEQYRDALQRAIDLIEPRLDSELTQQELEATYTGGSGWGDHPTYQRQQWRSEVANEDTQCGYWEWVYVMVQNEEQS